jgi:hypothetical protein
LLQSALAPQCVVSVFGSTHELPQFTCVPGHESVQTPFAQTVADVQIAPGSARQLVRLAPQWTELLEGSTHVPLQFVSAAEHVTAHRPLLHAWPAGHTTPGEALQSLPAPQ